MPHRIIFFTDLTLWSMGKDCGGPAFTKTVKKYIDEGWEVFLVSDEPSNKDYPYLDRAHNILLDPPPSRERGLIRRFGVIFRLMHAHWLTRAFLRVGGELLDKSSADTVVYAYEFAGVQACEKLAKRYGVPVVSRFQGTVVTYRKDQPLARLRLYPQCQALETPVDLAIMTDDGSFGERTMRELGNRCRILFLRNGLDLMEQDIPAMKGTFDRSAFRASLGVGEEETMFLTVSRLVDWKKVERAINGFAESLKTAPNSRLVIVGDGDSRPALEALAKELGIQDRVIFTGAVPHSAVYDYMMACDVFVSLYDLSNVGNPLLEAMTLGKCIVTLDVGDTKSLIHDRENGLLMTYDTLPQLGGVFAELAKDPALRQRLGAVASAYAQENFQSWKARMDAELSEVSKLIAKG